MNILLELPASNGRERWRYQLYDARVCSRTYSGTARRGDGVATARARLNPPCLSSARREPLTNHATISTVIYGRNEAGSFARDRHRTRYSTTHETLLL
ncbi:hypothetical protein EVAR_30468_1 [Eumeta japonica]|uniref:Uncharacterized protein n=1 Tax=Eumeta variegata TaxID=151549 RepID=A0A4C1VXG5_EUMVA|nr:hypothetical protein EVAR_30468_1 [Eumeta japonica]